MRQGRGLVRMCVRVASLRVSRGEGHSVCRERRPPARDRTELAGDSSAQAPGGGAAGLTGEGTGPTAGGG